MSAIAMLQQALWASGASHFLVYRPAISWQLSEFSTD
jgi:hypothetical protein